MLNSDAPPTIYEMLEAVFEEGVRQGHLQARQMVLNDTEMFLKARDPHSDFLRKFDTRPKNEEGE